MFTAQKKEEKGRREGGKEERGSFVPVVAGKEEGDTKRTQATVLGVGLLVIADGTHELLDGHGLLVLVQVALGGQAGWRKRE